MVSSRWPRGRVTTNTCTSAMSSTDWPAAVATVDPGEQAAFAPQRERRLRVVRVPRQSVEPPPAAATPCTTTVTRMSSSAPPASAPCANASTRPWRRRTSTASGTGPASTRWTCSRCRRRRRPAGAESAARPVSTGPRKLVSPSGGDVLVARAPPRGTAGRPRRGSRARSPGRTAPPIVVEGGRTLASRRRPCGRQQRDAEPAATSSSSRSAPGRTSRRERLRARSAGRCRRPIRSRPPKRRR